MPDLRAYGVSASISFPLIDAGTNDYEDTPVTFAAGDVQVSKDGGAFANAANTPTHVGGGIYSLVLSAAELQAAQVVVKIIDTAPKAWDDQSVIIETYGHPSAMHAAVGVVPNAASQVTVTVDDGANPVEGAQVAVYDATNTSLLRLGYTDASGEFGFAIDDGSYKVRLALTNYGFTVPEDLTVSGTTAQTYSGTLLFTVPTPTAPELCVIFGTNMTDAGGNDLVGACVQAYASTPQAVGGRQFSDVVATTTTDQNGNFTLELVRNVEVRFTIEDAGFDSILTVPDAASQDITTWS